MAKLFPRVGAIPLNLPGRVSYEVVSAAIGSDRVSLRLVEIEPEGSGDKRRGPHVHHAFEEVIHVLDGEGATEAPGGPYPLKPGDTLLVPAGEKHVTRNTGRGTLTLLCFFPIGDVGSGTEEFPDWATAGAGS